MEAAARTNTMALPTGDQPSTPGGLGVAVVIIQILRAEQRDGKRYCTYIVVCRQSCRHASVPSVDRENDSGARRIRALVTLVHGVKKGSRSTSDPQRTENVLHAVNECNAPA